MDRIAVIIMTSPVENFGIRIQKTLLDEFNCSLGNNLPASKTDPMLAFIYQEGKHILPMFRYKESWERRQETWEEWKEFVTIGNVYYFDMGAGDSNGLDEPGSRGEKGLRPFNYGRAFEENEEAHYRYPGAKTVVTHPFPLPFQYVRIPADVWAWRLPFLLGAGDDWRDRYFIGDKEVWGYLIDEDLKKDDLSGIGQDCRRLGLKGLLIYKAEHPDLYDRSKRNLWDRFTPKARGLLEGIRDA